MEFRSHPIKKFHPKHFDLEKTTSRITLGEVFADHTYSYLNEFTLFIAHFNSIPNCINEKDINCTKANEWFIAQYKAK